MRLSRPSPVAVKYTYMLEPHGMDVMKIFTGYQLSKHGAMYEITPQGLLSVSFGLTFTGPLQRVRSSKWLLSAMCEQPEELYHYYIIRHRPGGMRDRIYPEDPRQVSYNHYNKLDLPKIYTSVKPETRKSLSHQYHRSPGGTVS